LSNINNPNQNKTKQIVIGLDGAQSPNQRVTGQTILRHLRLYTRLICGVGLMSPPSLPWLEKLNPVRSSLWRGWLWSDCGVRSVLCGWWLVGVGLGMNGLVLKMNTIYIYIFRSAVVNERLKEINFMDCYFCFLLLMKASHKI
jgi:hypothetical protein